ncbi:MAG: MFS transporter [Chloroflexi bacterium]|nr:MFS transporter [Chloroflexota bacterium]
MYRMSATPATPATSRWGAAGDALRIPAFRVLVWTQVTMGLTQPLLFFTQGWYVNSAAPDGDEVVYLGLLGASRGVIFLLYVTVGGAIADRMPRLTVLRASHILALALILAIDALLWIPSIGSGAGFALPMMILLFASFGLITAQDIPTRTSMARETLPDHVAGGGIALFQLAAAAMLIISAPFAGWSIERLGIPTTYLLAATGPIAIVALSYLLPRGLAADPEASSASLLANVRDGLHIMREQPAIRWTVFLTWASTAAGISVMGIIVAAWVSDVLLLDAAGWGTMALFWGLGSLISSVFMTVQGFRRRRGLTFLGASLLFGIAVLGFSLSRSIPLAFAFNGLAGLAFMAFNIAGIGIVQALTPNRYLGRITGLLLFGQGLMQVIALGVGLFARAVGIEAVYVTAGILIIVATLAVGALQRPLRELD